MKTKVPRFARSSSTLARYRWSPVVFLSFFAILIKIIDERVSPMTNGTSRRYTAVILSRGEHFQSPVFSKRDITCIIWIQCIHFHSSLGFISIQPEYTGPNPVPPTASKAKMDIGSPRLRKSWMSLTKLLSRDILLRWPYIRDRSTNHGRPSRPKRAL